MSENNISLEPKHFKNIHLFNINNLTNNILKHRLVPPHKAIRERKDIDLLGNKLKEMKAVIIRGPMAGNWAPGYYYILFEDPDGIRLEVNYVPGEGVLDKNNKFNSNKDYL